MLYWFERLGILRFWKVSQNILILVIFILLVKSFYFVFTRGRRLKVELCNFWYPLWLYCLIISQFHFNCVSASPINFPTSITLILKYKWHKIYKRSGENPILTNNYLSICICDLWVYSFALMATKYVDLFGQGNSAV